jgi:DNA-binding NtrC family response regulator
MPSEGNVLKVESDRPSGTLEITRLGEERIREWLLEVQDDVGARRMPLPGDRTTVVGSKDRGDVVLDDVTVSARHLALRVDGTAVHIEDLGSKNGTFIGGARVTHARGESGTIIVLGRSTVTLRARADTSTDDDAEPLPGIAGASVTMRRIAARVRRFAANDLPVLVTGETGTGKELIARALHTESARASGPFVAVNVASLPRELVESEFFGHERGAFTGAVTKRAGAFAEAAGGTLFLDEIGEMAIDAQPKLLRALDGYEVRAVGGSGRGQATQARIVAATNRSLTGAASRGLFRQDLLHRLRVFEVRMPPVRARPADIGPIARVLLAHAPPGLTGRPLTSRALARLLTHQWPGNVRELRAVLFRAADSAAGERAIDLEHVEQALKVDDAPAPALDLDAHQAKALLAEHEGNIAAAARAAGMPRTTFRKLLKRA